MTRGDVLGQQTGRCCPLGVVVYESTAHVLRQVITLWGLITKVALVIWAIWQGKLLPIWLPFVAELIWPTRPNQIQPPISHRSAGEWDMMCTVCNNMSGTVNLPDNPPRVNSKKRNANEMVKTYNAACILLGDQIPPVCLLATVGRLL